jgi:SAM-dependent methyltransferase
MADDPMHTADIYTKKWGDFHARAFAPWDTGAAASQLVALVERSPHWARLTAEAAAHGRPIRTVELGCAQGGSVRWLASVGCEALGVDLVPAVVEEARRLASQAGTAGTAGPPLFTQGDVFALPATLSYATVAAAQGVPERSKSDVASAAAASDCTGCQLSLTAASAAAAVASAVATSQLVASAAAVGADAGVAGGGAFDLVFDCQCFHCELVSPARHAFLLVLYAACLTVRAGPAPQGTRVHDEAGAVAAAAALLRPGGLVLVLTGNANEPEVSPAVLTKDELVRAFTAGGQFALVDIAEGRFDPTPAYSSLEKGEPALLWAISFSARTMLVSLADASWLSGYADRCVVREGERGDALPLAWGAVFERFITWSERRRLERAARAAQ